MRRSLIGSLIVLFVALFVVAYRLNDRFFVDVLTAAGEWGIVVVIYLELEGAKRGRQADAALAVLQELRSEKAKKAREYIFKQLPDTPDGLDPDEIQKQLNAIYDAVITLHSAGFLLKAGDIDKKLQHHIMVFVWATATRCWNKSHKFIEYEAERRKDKSYMIYFKQLYELSEKYRQDNKLEIPEF